MKLQFKSQVYQTNAVNAVVDIFKGQSKGTREDIIGKSGLLNISKFSNKKLDDIDILENIKTIQKRDSLLKQSIDMKQGLNFTIEMETGTGKTYVYTKTIFELNKQYGWN